MGGPTSSGPHPVLAALPIHPLNQRPKLQATVSSPAEVPKTKTSEPLTPPSTPPKAENNRATDSVDGIAARISTDLGLAISPAETLTSTAEPWIEEGNGSSKNTLKLYRNQYQLQEELGYGLWSTVFKASEVSGPTIPKTDFPLSPPTSPTNVPVSTSKEIIAVKKPSRRDAYKILEKEAKTLTYNHLDKRALSFLVPFHGFHVAEHSIVMDAIPYNLEMLANEARERPLSTRTMFNPIIGGDEWSDLAQHLIDGLAFLHSRGCIHGDIKPGNILLKADRHGALTPLYCDFSSSRLILPERSMEVVDEVSAITADYTSPELLEALHKRHDDRVVATLASDVFALAVTLLFAAIGESPYACAHIAYQKLSMAKEGAPLEYARRGQQASRVMDGKIVATALRGGLKKNLSERLEIRAWQDEVGKALESWKAESRLKEV